MNHWSGTIEHEGSERQVLCALRRSSPDEFVGTMHILDTMTGDERSSFARADPQLEHHAAIKRDGMTGAFRYRVLAADLAAIDGTPVLQVAGRFID